jgi:phosphonate transport system substrate-binding protein
MTCRAPVGLVASRRVVVLGAMLACASLYGRPLRASEAVVRVGLVPYLSTRAMLGVFEPLRRHLESQLGRPVEFYTATGFAALAENARLPSQPFSLLPMHLAYLATTEWGCVLVARSTQESTVHLWAPRRLGTPAVEALRGMRVAVIDPLSIATLLFERWRAAVQMATALPAQVFPGLNSAVMAVTRGDADLVVAAVGQLRDLPGQDPDALQPVATLGTVLTPAFVAQRDTPAALVAAFRAALLSYRPAQAGGGASSAQWTEGTPRDLEPYKAFAAQARLLLAAGRPTR